MKNNILTNIYCIEDIECNTCNYDNKNPIIEKDIRYDNEPYIIIKCNECKSIIREYHAGDIKFESFHYILDDIPEKEKMEKIREKWSDEYFIKLGISDHLRECIYLYDNEYKSYKHDANLKKELADLYILLGLLFEKDNNKDFVASRINRFVEKIN